MWLRLPPLVWGLLALCCGVVAALAALQKRRNVGLWFLLGVLVPIVGVAVIAALPPRPAPDRLEPPQPDPLPDKDAARAERYQPRPGTVYCHHCGAPNPDAATFCSNCGELLRLT